MQQRRWSVTRAVVIGLAFTTGCVRVVGRGFNGADSGGADSCAGDCGAVLEGGCDGAGCGGGCGSEPCADGAVSATPCSKNADCPDVCVSRFCGPRSAPGGPCDETADCSAGVCEVGACQSFVGLGDSDFGPWASQTKWGSASGDGISRTRSLSQYPSVAVASDGAVFVAWRELPPGTSGVYVQVFRDGRWADVGEGSSANSGIGMTTGSVGPAIAVIDSDHPVVAWETDEGAIYLRRFDGGRWVELHGSASDTGLSGPTPVASPPRVALDPTSGEPGVAWVSTTGAVHFVRHTAGGWEGPAGSASGTGISGAIADAKDPDVIFDAAGRPVVSWSAAGGIYVRRLDGTWRELHGSGSGAGISAVNSSQNRPRVSIGDDDEPLVVWSGRSASLATVQVFAARHGLAGWEALGAGADRNGGLSDTPSASHFPAVAARGSNNVIAVWAEVQPTAHVRGLRFSDTSWNPLGSSMGATGLSGTTSGFAYGPSVALDPQGLPVVAWTHVGVNPNIYVRRFDGTSWRELGARNASGGGVSALDERSAGQRFAMTNVGPLLVWQQTVDGIDCVYAKRFNGESWEQIDGSASASGLSRTTGGTRPALAVDAGGFPLIAWTDSLAGEVYLKTLDDQGRWRELGTGSASGRGVSQTGGRSPAIAVAGSTVYIAYDNGEIFVRKLVDDSWLAASPGSASGNGISGDPTSESGLPSIVIDGSSRPLVSWRENVAGSYEVYVKRLEGDAWTEVDGSASGSSFSGVGCCTDWHSITVDALGRPVVAYESAADGTYQIYVVRLEDDRWQHVGPAPSAGGGVSGSDVPSEYPHLIVDAAGALVVAWQERRDLLSYEIFARRFDGQRWAELAAGAATDGGVSNSTGTSFGPAVAADADRTCIAWSEPGERSREILVRCVAEP